MWSNILRVIVYSLIGLGLLFGGVFLFSPRVNYQDPQRLLPLGRSPFTPAGWAAAGSEEKAAMLHDFVSRRLFEGKSSEQIQSLLGPPTARYLNSKNLAYRVGPSTIKSRFGEGYTFALVWEERTRAFDRFWIEPFPEETHTRVP